jgi:hypothetical protein
MRNRWVRALVFAIAGFAALYVAFESSNAGTADRTVLAQRSTCTTPLTQ